MRRFVTIAVGVLCLGCIVAISLTPGCSTAVREQQLCQRWVSGTAAMRSFSLNAVDPTKSPVEAPGHPGWIPVAGEELWVIEKPTAPPPVQDEETPRTGALMAKFKEEKEIPLPLKHTDVAAQISGYIATVEVTQEFHNPYDEKIEAVYVFPLPHNAAVTDFLMIIGERTIRGIIRERTEAQRIYAAAKRQGFVASLLTQERPNIFTQSVANIEPQKEIDVTITYFHTLAYMDGFYEFVFPMVVGPRFNPPGTTDGVGAVARGKPGLSGQPTEVQYLKPGERSGHEISVTVNIDAGVTIEDVASLNHVVKQESTAPEKATVTLSPRDAIPNKDFVLHYQVAGKRIKSSLMTHKDERGSFFTLMLYPPEDLSAIPAAPVEMIFVVDCSGSMSGRPIQKAKDAMRRALRNLGPNDTFQVIRFSNSASQLGRAPLPATAANVRRGLSFVESLQATGGTMMIRGIKAALDFPHDPERLRVVSFMTDGYIGNEREIFAEVHKRLGGARIFSFGVGSSVNRYLLEGLARLGKGAVAYVGLDESAGRAVDQFYERIRHPALMDVTMEAKNFIAEDVFPKRIPDLFVGRPVIVTGRYKGEGVARIRITGTAAGERKEILLTADLGDTAARHVGLPSIWARKKIMVLSDQSTHDRERPYATEIKNLALEFNLMSAYTAFVAVDSKTRTTGDHGTTVPVAVPVPEGVKYETTVDDGAGSVETSG